MMVNSLVYWAKEYHIDGFRFDLMALHDIETMKTIRTELDKVDDSILLYGEGWTGGDSPLPDSDKALKVNTVKYDKMQIAAFSDNSIDCIKMVSYKLYGYSSFIHWYISINTMPFLKKINIYLLLHRFIRTRYFSSEILDKCLVE